jgi:transposase
MDGKAFIMDLRERAMSRVEAGGSVRAVAASLSISPSCVVKWSQRFPSLRLHLARARGRARRTWAEGGLSIGVDLRAWKLSFKKNRASERARACRHRPQTGALEELPYSPDLNPIEQVFAKLKYLLRKAKRLLALGSWTDLIALIRRKKTRWTLYPSLGGTFS